MNTILIIFTFIFSIIIIYEITNNHKKYLKKLIDIAKKYEETSKKFKEQMNKSGK